MLLLMRSVHMILAGGKQLYRDLAKQEIVKKRYMVIKFNANNSNPVMQMVKFLNENYKGEKIIHEDKSG